ncbi:putative Tic20 family protein [Alkalibacillus flavidus]|uniref:Tic20 family protein n=1 Tax=Alkalibacillus flavidus TaxID=546021 RepID=A0ABV2KYE5_9BACI
MREVITPKDRLMVTIGYLLPLVLPLTFLNIWLTVLYWYVAPYQSPFFDHHMRENINAQISYQLYIVIGFILFFLLGSVASVGIDWLPDLAKLSIPLFAMGLMGIIFIIIISWWFVYLIAIIAALAKKYFRFPLIIRFIK